MFDLFGNAYHSKTLPLGIPYMGSKRKHADKLICKMMEIVPSAKYFVDLCGGGGAMSFAAAQKGLDVHYNELHRDMCELMSYLLNPTEKSKYGIFPEAFYRFVTRDEFNQLKDESGIYAQVVKICYSFGNKQTSYAFGIDVEPLKHLAHDVVMYQCGKSLKALNHLPCINLTISRSKHWNERRAHFCSQITQAGRRTDLQQLQQLDQLQQLERLGNIRIPFKMKITNLSYENFALSTDPKKTIVYIDPPYRGTAKYITDIDHEELDKWFVNLPYVAFMSEYEAPHKCIYEVQTRSTIGKSNTTAKIERLYINAN